MKRDRTQTSRVYPLALTVAVMFLSGCQRTTDQTTGALQPGDYVFVLNHDDSDATSAGSRDLVNHSLSPSEFSLPSRFTYTDRSGFTLGIADLKALALDNIPARKLQLGPTLRSLQSFLNLNNPAGLGIDPWAVHRAADALGRDHGTNKAVFFVGKIDTNRSPAAEDEKPTSRFPAYWLLTTNQAPAAIHQGKQALFDAGFDVVTCQSESPLFWAAVHSVQNERVTMIAKAGDATGQPSHKPQPARGDTGQPTSVGKRPFQGDSATRPTNDFRNLTVAAGVDPVEAQNLLAAGGVSAGSVPSMEGAGLNPADSKLPSPLSTSHRPATLTPKFAATEASPPVVTSRPNLKASAQSDGLSRAALAGTSVPGKHPEVPNAARVPGDSAAVAGVASPASKGSSGRKDGEPRQSALAQTYDGSANLTQLPEIKSEADLLKYLDEFGLEGTNVLAKLPPEFVAIRYSSQVSEPVSMALNVAEKREFDFPGTAAGTSRFIHKSSWPGHEDAFDGCGFSDEKLPLVITIMRRADSPDHAARPVDLIIRRQGRITIRRVDLPAEAGMVLALDRLR